MSKVEVGQLQGSVDIGIMHTLTLPAGVKRIIVVMHLCFFLSAFAALVYQMVWCRLLLHVFGAAPLATAVVLSSVMAGLALGAYLGGKLAHKLDRPVQAYAFIELAIALSAAITTQMLQQKFLVPVWQAFRPLIGISPPVTAVCQVVICVVALIAPTCLLGATLPVLSKYLYGRTSSFAQSVGYLYATNNCGAVAGTIAGGFLIIPSFGLSLSTYVGVAANLLAGLLALSQEITLTGACAPEFAHPGEGGPCQPGRQSAAAASARDSLPESIKTPAGMAETKPDLPAAAQAYSGGHEQAAGGRGVSRALPACAVFFSGCVFLALELAWSRLFNLILGSMTYSISIVVAAVLCGISAGSYLVLRFCSKAVPPLVMLSLMQALAALWLYASTILLERIPWVSVSLAHNLIESLGTPAFAAALIARALIAGLVILPAATLMGGAFPLALRSLAPGSSGEAVGNLYGANTTGSIVGAWLGSFILLPYFSATFTSGLQASLLVLGLSLALAALVLLVALTPVLKGSIWTATAAAACLIASLLGIGLMLKPPRWDTLLMSSGAALYLQTGYPLKNENEFMALIGATAKGRSMQPVLYYKEGLNTTVTVTSDRNHNLLCLKNDGKVEASLPLDTGKSAAGSDLPTQILLGALPCLLHKQPENVLLIGLGTGATAGGVLTFPQVKHLTVAELEKAVIDANQYFDPVNLSPLQASPERLNLLNVDGRAFLATADATYDVIVSQPADPWVNGASELFTKEYWQIGRSRLKSGGIFCQWLQLYAINEEYLGVILRTFQSVFPETLLFHPENAGEVLLLGFKDRARVDPQRIAQRFDNARIRQLFAGIGYLKAEAVTGTLTLGPAEVRELCRHLAIDFDNAGLNTDNNLLTEYQLPKELFGSFEAQIDNNLKVIYRASIRRGP